MDDESKEDKKSCFEKVKSIPVLEWSKQKAVDLANGIQSNSKHCISGTGYYLNQVGSATVSSINYLGETSYWLVGAETQNDKNFKLSLSELYPNVVMLSDDISAYSNIDVSPYMFSYVSLNSFKESIVDLDSLDNKNAFQRVKSIPILKWSTQKTFDAANAVKSFSDHYIPGTGYYLNKAGDATVSSTNYVGDTLCWLVGSKVSSGVDEISNMGLDMIEQKYPIINKPIDDVPEFSKQAAAAYMFSYFGLNSLKMYKSVNTISETSEEAEKRRDKDSSKWFSLKSSISFELKTPEGTSYELNYVPFHLRDGFVWKTVTSWWFKPKDE